MPPRIRWPTGLSVQFSAASADAVSCSRSFASSAAAQASAAAKKRKPYDPYAIAQAKAKKAAHMSRKEVLKQERAGAVGDPVRGTATEYIRSFDDDVSADQQSPSPAVQARLGGSPADEAAAQATPSDAAAAPHTRLRNFFLQGNEVDTVLERSKQLTNPTEAALERQRKFHTDDLTPDERRAASEARHDTAAEALRRISSLNLGSAQDRMRAIKQRCIADFGRHNTEKFLPPKPQAAQTHAQQSVKTPAAGPDTGSSEVQIAILTAKIHTLANFLETRGTGDKVNKRNLRLLVHRRQKLLQYLRRKERGGPRWQHVIETLGLTEATWQGEISL